MTAGHGASVRIPPGDEPLMRLDDQVAEVSFSRFIVSDIANVEISPKARAKLATSMAAALDPGTSGAIADRDLAATRSGGKPLAFRAEEEMRRMSGGTSHTESHHEESHAAKGGRTKWIIVWGIIILAALAALYFFAPGVKSGVDGFVGGLTSNVERVGSPSVGDTPGVTPCDAQWYHYPDHTATYWCR